MRDCRCPSASFSSVALSQEWEVDPVDLARLDQRSVNGGAKVCQSAAQWGNDSLGAIEPF